jgi:hypothetical protein
VRELRGLVGAASLAKSVPGISRRQAAAIKRKTLTAMERERIEACGRVSVNEPGVMRGFDAMQFDVGEKVWTLISGDAAVQYRTSATVVDSYSGTAVADAIDRDFTINGAPLVWRVDRCTSHSTFDVSEVLKHHGVLVLHGPPHHPGYYGQLERQNREHRAWIDQSPPRDRDELDEAVPEMLGALNGQWRRRTLDWKTAEEAWTERQPLQVDRAELRDEVESRAERIKADLGDRAPTADFAWRLSIETTLVKRGLLTISTGNGC